MKKFLLTAASFGLAFAISACSDDSSSSTGPEESGKTGDYTEYGSIDKDAKKVLAAAVKGTDFESIECDRVATQVVAGTNYKFQCNVKMDKESVEVFLTVFEPLPSSEESVKLTLVEDASGKVLYKAEEKTVDPKEEEKESGKTGGFTEYKAVDKDAEKILAEVVEGTEYAESLECDSVATQVVAGTNYKFQCSVKQGEISMDVFVVIFKPLPGSGESAQLTLIEDASGKVLYEAKAVDPKEEEKESGKTGGFTEYKAVDKDAEKILAEVVKGSSFESIECDSVAKQVVAGTNYKFKCSVNDEDVILEVFENLEGKVKLGDVIPSNDEDVDDDDEKAGAFSDFTEINEAAQKVLDAAIKGSDYESAKCSEVAKQVVAGTNYKFKCSVNDEDVILEVFEDLEGEVKLGDVIPSNEGKSDLYNGINYW